MFGDFATKAWFVVRKLLKQVVKELVEPIAVWFGLINVFLQTCRIVSDLQSVFFPFGPRRDELLLSVQMSTVCFSLFLKSL